MPHYRLMILAKNFYSKRQSGNLRQGENENDRGLFKEFLAFSGSFGTMYSTISVRLFDDIRLHLQLEMALSGRLVGKRFKSENTQGLAFNRWHRSDYLQHHLLCFPRFIYLELLVVTNDHVH